MVENEITENRLCTIGISRYTSCLAYLFRGRREMEDHWKVLLAVVYILAAALLFTRFEGLLEAGLAFLLLAAVVVGFFLHALRNKSITFEQLGRFARPVVT